MCVLHLCALQWQGYQRARFAVSHGCHSVCVPQEGNDASVRQPLRPPARSRCGWWETTSPLRIRQYDSVSDFTMIACCYARFFCRLSSAGDLLHNVDSLLNVARRKGMIMHGILTAPDNRNVSVLLDDDVSFGGTGECIDLFVIVNQTCDSQL
jgi:hypothetical protein